MPETEGSPKPELGPACSRMRGFKKKCGRLRYYKDLGFEGTSDRTMFGELSILVFLIVIEEIWHFNDSTGPPN